MRHIDIELLRKVLKYIPDTGQFVWNERPLSMFKDERCWKKWNSRYSGMVAGRKGTGGYVQITARCCGAKVVSAHRLAWLYIYGTYPDHDIDHINGVRHDNRISNLRQATRKQNTRYAGISRRNSSGYKGVTWCKERRCYSAAIAVNRKRINLGRFSDPKEAALAYDEAAVRLHGDFAKTNKMLGLL